MNEKCYEVGNGWIPLIKSAEKIIDDWNKNNPNEEIPLKLVQVKEKWGGLCLYLNYYLSDICNEIREIENKSYHVCENCGTTENVHTNCINGWYITLCDNCKDEYQK